VRYPTLTAKPVGVFSCALSNPTNLSAAFIAASKARRSHTDGPFSLESTTVTKETYLKPREAAEYLRSSTSTLAKARMKKQGPDYVRIGRAIRYPCGQKIRTVDEPVGRSASASLPGG
jgi:hypothetical protein